VQVNGEPVRFPYAQPTQVAGRVMVPLRGVLERLGADRIDWRPQTQEVFVSGVGGDIILRIGERTATVGGRQVALDVPPLILQQTTMVPLRFVSENLGARVDWMPATQTVYIATPNQRVAGSRERLPADQNRYGSTRESPAPRTGGYTREAPPRRDDGSTREPARSSYITRMFPVQGTTVSNARPEIFAHFRANAPIKFNSVQITLNGRDVTRDAEITADGVRYLPVEDLRRGRNDVRLTFRDTSGVLTTQEWYFYSP
jgi:copper amine oxidase-like protein